MIQDSTQIQSAITPVRAGQSTSTDPGHPAAEFPDTAIVPSALNTLHTDQPAKIFQETQTLPGPVRLDPVSRPRLQDDGLLIWLLFGLVAFTWSRYFYLKYIQQMLLAVTSYIHSFKLLRDRNILYRNVSIGLNLVFMVVMGIFLAHAAKYLEIGQFYSSFTLTAIFLGLITSVLFFLKKNICQFLGFLFQKQEEFGEYTHNLFLYNKVMGVFLIPVAIMIPYSSESLALPLLVAGFLVICTSYVFLLFRSFQIIVKKNISIFYLVLYLCIFEFFPVAIALKISNSMI